MGLRHCSIGLMRKLENPKVPSSDSIERLNGLPNLKISLSLWTLLYYVLTGTLLILKEYISVFIYKYVLVSQDALLVLSVCLVLHENGPWSLSKSQELIWPLLQKYPFMSNPRSRVLLERQTVPHPVKKLPSFYGRKMLITMQARARKWTVSWAKLI